MGDRAVALRAAPRTESSVRDGLAAELEKLGIEVSHPFRRGAGEWLVTDDPRKVQGAPELVVATNERSRWKIESTRPDLMGHVWISHDPSELAELASNRYRPRPHSHPAKIGVIGYNLKFARPIFHHLRRIPNVAVQVAEWPKYAVDHPPQTAAVLDWADTLWCEWAGPNAAMAARQKRPDQRLIVRLHRFELERDEWKGIDPSEIDRVVTVGDHYRRRTLEVTGWPEQLLTVIPNLVDTPQLDRPKYPGASKTLGLLGATPWRKRPDRAVDVLVELLRKDPEWRLSIKGERPTDERWIGDDPTQRANYQALYQRIDELGEAVVWQPHGPDVAEWFRSVGYILSPSDDESFHLAPAEGMASGTVPLIWPWPGSAAIYDDRWRVSNPGEAVRAIDSTSDDDRLRARNEVEKFERSRVLAEWERLLLRQ